MESSWNSSFHPTDNIELEGTSNGKVQGMSLSTNLVLLIQLVSNRDSSIVANLRSLGSQYCLQSSLLGSLMFATGKVPSLSSVSPSVSIRLDNNAFLPQQALTHQEEGADPVELAKTLERDSYSDSKEPPLVPQLPRAIDSSGRDNGVPDQVESSPLLGLAHVVRTTPTPPSSLRFLFPLSLFLSNSTDMENGLVWGCFVILCDI